MNGFILKPPGVIPEIFLNKNDIPSRTILHCAEYDFNQSF